MFVYTADDGDAINLNTVTRLTVVPIYPTPNDNPQLYFGYRLIAFRADGIVTLAEHSTDGTNEENKQARDDMMLAHENIVTLSQGRDPTWYVHTPGY